MMLVLDYFKDVCKEVKNITFPGKNDVILTSCSVFVIILITMSFIFITDCVISKVIKSLLGM